MEQIIQTGKGFEKASAKLTTEQLDRPIDEVVAEPAVESVPEEAIEVPEAAPEAEEEDKVPKSRFLTMSQRAIAAEKANRAYEAERALQPERQSPVSDEEWAGNVREYFTKTFGDTPQAKELADNEIARISTIEERAAERAFERLTQRQQEEESVIEDRVKGFDSAFEELGIMTGKDSFSDEEQVEILDIVEEYSPKDSSGKIPAEYLLDLDKAYEIYQLRHETVAPKKTERNAVAALTGARTEGTPGATSDADWKPGESGRYLRKLQK